LNLGNGETWRHVNANIYKQLDGKKMLFENDDSLFQKLRSDNPLLILQRDYVAGHMDFDEIHEDVHVLMAKIKALVE